MTTTTTLNVENVATHADLVEEVPQAVLNRVMKSALAADTQPARLKALEETTKALSRRMPPIVDSDLSSPTELRDCVVYGALWRIYRDAMTQGSADALFTKQAEDWRDKYTAELRALSPSLDGGVRGPTLTLVVSRR